jgi:uncharacterized protein YlzI (FlbEa/FlbD family)
MRMVELETTDGQTIAVNPLFIEQVRAGKDKGVKRTLITVRSPLGDGQIDVKTPLASVVKRINQALRTK